MGAFILPSRQWDTTKLMSVFSINTCNKTMALHISSDPSFADVVAWLPLQDGNFSLKSAYDVISGKKNTMQQPIYKYIWKWQGP